MDLPKYLDRIYVNVPYDRDEKRTSIAKKTASPTVAATNATAVQPNSCRDLSVPNMHLSMIISIALMNAAAF